MIRSHEQPRVFAQIPATWHSSRHGMRWITQVLRWFESSDCQDSEDLANEFLISCQICLLLLVVFKTPFIHAQSWFGRKYKLQNVHFKLESLMEWLMVMSNESNENAIILSPNLQLVTLFFGHVEIRTPGMSTLASTCWTTDWTSFTMFSGKVTLSKSSCACRFVSRGRKFTPLSELSKSLKKCLKYFKPRSNFLRSLLFWVSDAPPWST